MRRYMADGRSPYGERGLKYQGRIPPVEGSMSLSLRRAWIEISTLCPTEDCRRCRSPYGERGLKFQRDGVRTGLGQVALLTESVD